MSSIHEVHGGSRGHVAEGVPADARECWTLILGIYGRRGTAKHGVIFVDAVRGAMSSALKCGSSAFK